MGFFDALKDKAADLAQAGVTQSKRLAEIAKLKAANLGEEDNIKKAYIEIGKLYYAEKGMTPDGAYVAACDKITAAKAAIETNNDRIAELKTAAEAEGEPVAAEETYPGQVVSEEDIEDETPAAPKADEAPASQPEQE